jgi:hypothetical protein
VKSKNDLKNDLKKKEAGITTTKGAIEAKQSSGKRKECVLPSVFRSRVESFEKLKLSSSGIDTCIRKYHMIMIS